MQIDNVSTKMKNGSTVTNSVTNEGSTGIIYKIFWRRIYVKIAARITKFS